MIWKIGHRGACGYAPENTLASMKKAIELGVDGIEFDIQLSKEGEAIVIHDETLERTTNGKGRTQDYTLKELKQFDAGSGEKIPSLSDVLDFVDKRCRMLIELKAPHSTQPVAEVIAHYVKKRGWNYEQLFVCSFDHTQIVDIRRINPSIRTSALIAGIPVSLAAIAQEAGAWSINPNVHHISKALVDDAHWRGIKVIPWTANDPRDIVRMKELGVDGIIGNYPDRL